MKFQWFAVAALCLACWGCGSEPPATKPRPRTVEVDSVTSQPPKSSSALTGVAEPYRESALGFEVAGRLTTLRDVGMSVEVRTERTRDGSLENIGNVIAQIDDTTYRQQLEAAQLRLSSAMAGIKASMVDVEQVVPASIARAKAQRDASRKDVEAARASLRGARSNEALARANFDRAQRLFASKTVAKAELDQQSNAWDAAKAGVTRAQSGLDASQEKVTSLDAAVEEAKAMAQLKRQNLERARAESRELHVAVQQAQTNVDRCTLRAPFSGRITRVHVSQGDLVQAGVPVVTLTLIDPIKVSVTVSADQERAIAPGEHAFVTPHDLSGFGDDSQLVGTVFEKGSVADPATRTFRIDVMVRNARRLIGGDEDSKGAMPISFRQLLPAVERNFGNDGPLFLCTTCLVKEQDAHVVYRIPGARFGVPRPPGMFKGRIQLEKLTVVPHGEGPSDYFQILNWRFQRVSPVSGTSKQLQRGDLLVDFDGLDPKDIGAQGIRLNRFEWAIRPGDLVPVSFAAPAEVNGNLYVPTSAIVVRSDNAYVYAIRDGVAKRITVTKDRANGNHMSVRASGLKAGDKVVVRGAHYCEDGAPVRVLRDHSARKSAQ